MSPSSRSVKRPLYLTGMAVSVTHQRQGLGRLALDDACAVAEKWPADAIRLDAYDAEAGAGGFYRPLRVHGAWPSGVQGHAPGVLRATAAVTCSNPSLQELVCVRASLCCCWYR